jgi:hypothetical protein
MRVRGIVIFWLQVIRTNNALPGQREWSRPKHDVTEGIMTSAEDMRLEATLLIGVSSNALQRQTRMSYTS